MLHVLAIVNHKVRPVPKSPGPGRTAILVFGVGFVNHGVRLPKSGSRFCDRKPKSASRSRDRKPGTLGLPLFSPAVSGRVVDCQLSLTTFTRLK